MSHGVAEDLGAEDEGVTGAEGRTEEDGEKTYNLTLQYKWKDLCLVNRRKHFLPKDKQGIVGK